MHATPVAAGLAGMTLLAATGLAPEVPPRIATGTIAGRVIYSGAVPPALTVPESGGVQPVLYVGSGGELRYVVVSVADAAPAQTSPVAPATIKQAGYVFVPQVTAVGDGARVAFTNDDVANHNVRASRPPNVFELKTSRAPVTATIHATSDGAPIVITCDIHAWMTAWVYAFTHPLFAVTGPDGRFRIENVPEGPHDLLVEQPSGGLRRLIRVSVPADGVATIPDVVFTSADLHLPAN